MEEKVFNEQLKLTVASINAIAIGALAWAVLRPIFIEEANISIIGALVSISIHLYARLFLNFLKSEP